jgi:hypothetical protein
MREYYEKYNVDSFRSLMRIYSIHDICPLLQSTILLSNLYREREVDAFKNHVSLPSLSFAMAITPALEENPHNWVSVLRRDIFEDVRQSIQVGVVPSLTITLTCCLFTGWI